ncbi:hypothetical protein BpHYR1_014118 [Brachionus plicatilis]|uniref:Uncharacterized protein n=1 Tax=Brachionus plicatilis TaxID=10195 RepID=A0A3M7RYW6_BRAPC|nr:hypothetical protein BpHYR1_014118 [Brachionus plicatilis]
MEESVVPTNCKVSCGRLKKKFFRYRGQRFIFIKHCFFKLRLKNKKFLSFNFFPKIFDRRQIIWQLENGKFYAALSRLDEKNYRLILRFIII